MSRSVSKMKFKRRKAYYPDVRSQQGAKHSFKFSVRAWFNFKTYAILTLLLVAAAVVTFALVPSAEFNTESPKDTFYTYDENVEAEDKTENASKAADISRSVARADKVLFSSASTCTHNWVEEDRETVTPATCNENGMDMVTERCSDCEQIRISYDVIDAAHTPDTQAVTVPGVDPVGCTTAGYSYSVVYCVVCSEELSKTVISVPASHTPGSAEVDASTVVAADCVNDGKYDIVVNCTVCSGELSRTTVVVPALGHDEAFSEENAVAPTCTVDGSHDEVVTCNTCGAELSRTNVVDPAIGHAYSHPCLDVLCSNGCGLVNPDAGHEIDEMHVHEKQEPTCTEDGRVVYVPFCTTCNEAQGTPGAEEVLPMNGHEYDFDCDKDCNVCGEVRDVKHVSAAPATCTDPEVCTYCDVELSAAKGHTRNACRDEVCTTCEGKIDPILHTDKDGDFVCDVKDCEAVLRTINKDAVVYFTLLAITAFLALIFFIRTLSLIIKTIRISSIRLEFYDEVLVWKWGVSKKNHIEKRFIGVYDIKVMPNNKYPHKESKKIAKFGTVLAKTPGGDYSWNEVFYGVKEYIQLKNYLQSRKIGERFDHPRTNICEDGI